MLQDKRKRINISIVKNARQETRLCYGNLLEQDNFAYNIIEAECGTTGLIKCALHQPDIILIDYLLSDFDGWEFINQLNNKIEELPPIILLIDQENQINNLFQESKNEKIICLVKSQLTATLLQYIVDNAIKQSSLQKTLAKNIWQQQLITDIALRTRKSLSLKFIFNQSTQEILDFLSCDRLSLVRLARQEIHIESQSVANSDIQQKLPQLVSAHFNLHSSKIDLVAKTNQFQLFVPILLEQAIVSSTHYPLWGWLVAEQHFPRQWHQSEQIFLEQFAVQLSIALSQKLLYKQLKNINRQLEISNVSNQYLKKLSLKDSLTKVYNRRYFKQQFNKEWFRLRRTGSFLSVIIGDIDYFKLYNDTYGHQQGDFCLKQVAEAMTSTLKRPGDILARYGGEEFVAILPNTDGAGAVKVAEAMRLSVKELQIPHSSSEVSSEVTISIGVATTIPDAQYSPEMLIEAADDALYLAKNLGRDGVAVHQRSIDQFDYRQNQDREWVERIHHALENNLFQLYAQPIASLKDDGRHHFEILLRLEDRPGKIFTSKLFLEIAQRNCLMSNIDTWVIDRLFEQLTAQGDNTCWQNYQFSLELSAASIDNPIFLDFVSRKLKEYDLEPQLFCFEITEAIAVDNIKQIRDFIVSLKKLGCSFALDNFGKGMGSLTYLQELPVDYLKIDGSLISKLRTDKVAQLMIEAINHLATGIGLKTIAKYVESQEILDILRLLDLDYAQGDYLGRPQKLSEAVQQRVSSCQIVN